MHKVAKMKKWFQRLCFAFLKSGKGCFLQRARGNKRVCILGTFYKLCALCFLVMSFRF